MKRKVLIIVLLIALCASAISLSVYAYSDKNNESKTTQPVDLDPEIAKSQDEAAQYEELPPIDASDDKYVVEGDKRDLLVTEPEPVFQGNKDLETYFDIDSRIDEKALAAVGAKILVKAVMPYEEYLEKFGEERLTAIALDRVVWVLQVYYPKGYETKRGLYEDATVTGLYDAETGYYHGFSLTGKCDNTIMPSDKK